ncbi:hypothetical protein [Orientia tsutsugamushi]|uniref:hypothetical protein n=1 Tax=Orientia tsutsugamushi TaxID=784 RepID=UPI000D65863F
MFKRDTIWNLTIIKLWRRKIDNNLAKKVSENFLLKSFLVAKGLLPAPLGYSRLLGKKVGK